MIDGVHAAQSFGQRRVIHRVRAVGIAHRRVCRAREALVGDDGAVVLDKVCALLDGAYAAHRHLMEGYHIRYDMPLFGLLAEDKAHGGHPVAQRHGLHRQRVVLIYHCALRLDDVILDSKGGVVAKDVHHLLQYLGALLKGVHHDRAAAIVQRQRGEQPRQPQEMVAVEVRDEDVIETREFQMHAPQLQLCPLAAIDHKQAVAEVYHLARGLVTHCGSGGAASEDIDSKLCHCYRCFS